MKQQLIMVKGLPASGKSTWARDKVRFSNNFKRINKDDLRLMIDDSNYSKNNEKFIVKMRNVFVKEALENGYSVIVDDTNFDPKHEQKLREIAERQGVEFIIEYKDVDLDTCLKRNLERKNSVPEKVIWDMYTRYVLPERIERNKVKYDPKLDDCIIVDLDGTLALHTSSRSPYHWNRVGEDIVNKSVQDVIDSMDNLFRKFHIVFMSGRDGVSKNLTVKWLKDNHCVTNLLNDWELHMRAEGDQRKDSIVKLELYEKHVKNKYNVKFVLDDRDQVVRMWREQGLNCFQVNYGNF